MPDKEGREVITACLEICGYRITRLIGEIDDPELTSLSSHGELHGIEIHVIAVECREL